MCLIILMSKLYGNLRCSEESSVCVSLSMTVLKFGMMVMTSDCQGSNPNSAVTLDKSFTGSFVALLVPFGTIMLPMR